MPESLPLNTSQILYLHTRIRTHTPIFNMSPTSSTSLCPHRYNEYMEKVSEILETYKPQIFALVRFQDISDELLSYHVLRKVEHAKIRMLTLESERMEQVLQVVKKRMWGLENFITVLIDRNVDSWLAEELFQAYVRHLVVHMKKAQLQNTCACVQAGVNSRVYRVWVNALEILDKYLNEIGTSLGFLTLTMHPANSALSFISDKLPLPKKKILELTDPQLNSESETSDNDDEDNIMKTTNSEMEAQNVEPFALVLAPDTDNNPFRRHSIPLNIVDDLKTHSKLKLGAQFSVYRSCSSLSLVNSAQSKSSRRHPEFPQKVPGIIRRNIDSDLEKVYMISSSTQTPRPELGRIQNSGSDSEFGSNSSLEFEFQQLLGSEFNLSTPLPIIKSISSVTPIIKKTAGSTSTFSKPNKATPASPISTKLPKIGVKEHSYKTSNDLATLKSGKSPTPSTPISRTSSIRIRSPSPAPSITNTGKNFSTTPSRFTNSNTMRFPLHLRLSTESNVPKLKVATVTPRQRVMEAIRIKKTNAPSPRPLSVHDEQRLSPADYNCHKWTSTNTSKRVGSGIGQLEESSRNLFQCST